MRKNGVQTLMMGGQACVFYGAAEFSRDLDLLLLADSENLARLQSALHDLDAEPIAVPPFDAKHLAKGHAVQFRCRRADVEGLRIDIMTRLRGFTDFAAFWDRRTTIEVNGEPIDLLGIEDLVRAKKTQRGKDWPMIKRLVERNYFEFRAVASSKQVEFWLRELRSPELLVIAAQAHPDAAQLMATQRSAVAAAIQGEADAAARALEEEEQDEKRKDREYWAPLKRELEDLRHGRV